MDLHTPQTEPFPWNPSHQRRGFNVAIAKHYIRCALMTCHGDLRIENAVVRVMPQLIRTMLEQGIYTVSSITHAEESSGKIRPFEGKELISIWKQVHGEIQSRRGKTSMQADCNEGCNEARKDG